MNPPAPQPDDERVRLQRRYDRERSARLAAEATAEQGLRNLFERKRELELLQAVASAANEAHDTSAVLHVALHLLCDYTGWPLGHVFRPTDNGTELVSTGLWHVQSATRFAEFQAATQRIPFAPGVGLPGRVWRKGRAVWVVDVQQDTNFPRAPEARQCGLHAAFAFPVLAATEVCAVVELFAQNITEPDEALIELVSQVGMLLGRVFERAAADETIRAAHHKLEERVRQRTAELDRANLLATTNEKRYRQVLYSLDEVVFQTDSNGAWTLLNPAWTELTGHPVEDSLGRCYADFLHPDDLAAGLKVLPPLIHSQTEECRLQIRFLTRGGNTRWGEWRARPLRNEAGECIGTSGTIADVTERHEADLTLHAANDQLARAARLKDEFLAAMSHELRTPLNAVLGFSEVLMEGVYGDLNDKQRRAITNIQDSGRHLLALINDILDLSKIEAGKEKLTFDTVFLDALCESSLQFVRTLAVKKRLRLTLTIDPAADTFQGDERRLRQILVNLLTNAVKFTPEGGQVSLEARIDPAARTVALTVADSGIGISAEDQKKLFQPFVQLDSKLSRQYSGTGLGLSLVQRLAELHGGGVNLESEPGKGSRFTVTLPWQPPAPAPAATSAAAASAVAALVAASAPAALSGPRPVVLLAEDNAMNRETIVTYLTAKGYCVLIAENGEEAVRQAQAAQPAIILMDVQMPGMDGLEATSILKSRPATARTPVLMLTALAMSGDRERCLAAGADDYLSKPVNLRDLLARIQRHLEHSPA